MLEFIGVIGSASADSETEEQAYQVGHEVIKAGFSLVCGGLGGVMRAAARGAQEAKRASQSSGSQVVMGILPMADKSAANEYIDIAVPTGLGYARNILVVLASDGVIAVHGGAGTLSEVAMAWQYHRPIVVLKPSGGWAERLAGEKLDAKRSDAIISAHDPGQAVRLVAKCIHRTAGEIDGP